MTEAQYEEESFVPTGGQLVSVRGVAGSATIHIGWAQEARAPTQFLEIDAHDFKTLRRTIDRVRAAPWR